MDTETAANPAGGEETHVNASEPADTGAQVETVETEQQVPEGSETATPEEDEFEEVERGEKKYRVPKALKSELLMHADYTRKTMELADQRKALDAAKAEIEQAKSLTTEERRAYAKLDALHEQVAAYEKVDWDALEASDPQEAQRHWRQYQTAVNQRNQVVAALQQHEAQKAQRSQQETAKQRQDREEQLGKEIPNWSPAKRQEIEKFASEHGYTADALDATATARDFKILSLALEGQKFIQRQRAAARAAAQGSVRPAPEVGGTAAAGLDPNKMTFEQYKAARESGKL